MEKSIEQALEGFKNDLYEDLDISENAKEDHLSPERNGNFTGSGFTKLMTSKSRKKGLNWSMREKLVDLGDTALNYCLENAVERITGERVESGSTWEMNWGTNHESVAREEVHAQHGVELPEQDFIFFFKNAGSTPDSFIENFTDHANINVEIKCPPKHLNHAKYLSQPVDEKHEYFWQIQAEMLSQSAFRKIPVTKTQFFTFHPCFSESTKLGGSIVEASETHQRALKIRCIIGERIIQGLVDCDLRRMPHDFLPDAIKDIPESFDELLQWYEKEIKTLEV